jgi:2-amino-4-hydroxy-6-hydroxymethyldihydropteridine diphosphokinase
MVPLAELAPGWIHPVLGRSVEALIAGLPAQEVRAL